MKTRITSVFVIIFILLTVIALCTNPSKEVHVECLSKKLQLYENNKNNDTVEWLMEELMLESFISVDVDYFNFYIFSYANYKPTTGTTIGLFDTVFVLE